MSATPERNWSLTFAVSMDSPSTVLNNANVFTQRALRNILDHKAQASDL